MSSLIDIFDDTQGQFPEAETFVPSLGIREGETPNRLRVSVFFRDADGKPMAAVSMTPEAAFAFARWIADTAFRLHGLPQGHIPHDDGRGG